VRGSPVPGFHISKNQAVRLPLYAGGALEERERTDNPFPSASVPYFGRRKQSCFPVSTLQTLGLRLPAVRFNLGLAFGDAVPPLSTHLDNTQSVSFPPCLPTKTKKGQISSRAPLLEIQSSPLSPGSESLSCPASCLWMPFSQHVGTLLPCSRGRRTFTFMETQFTNSAIRARMNAK
jgi:hypothetical protein